MILFNQVKLVFLFIINKNVHFECISIAKHIINLVNDKLKVKYIRKLVKKSYTPVVPIANTCSIGYPHDSRADNAAYRHDRRADNAAYRHDRRADSLSRTKLPMNADIYSTGFVFETVWRRIVGGATGTRATIIKWPLGGLSNLFIFISD